MTALLTAKAEKLEELSKTLQFLMTDIRSHSGCLDALVARELGDEARFVLHCLWVDRSALETYLGSEGFRVLRGASSILTGPDGFLVAVGHPESPPLSLTP
jgi:quinol monooxygenase YgiN